MIALAPPEDVAALLAVPGGIDPDDLHLTVAFTGPADNVDPDQLADVVRELADRPAIAGAVSGLARWSAGEDEDGNPRDCVVALVDAPGLDELRADTIAALTAAGISPVLNHGYTAHITLGYLAPGDTAPITRIDTIPVELDTIVGVHANDWVAEETLDPDDTPDDAEDDPGNLDDNQADPAEKTAGIGNVEVKVGFSENEHPRDSEGKWIRKGARVSVIGGVTGTVEGTTGNGRIVVRTDDGKLIERHKRYMTVLAEPGGGAPTAPSKKPDGPALDLVEDTAGGKGKDTREMRALSRRLPDLAAAARDTSLPDEAREAASKEAERIRAKLSALSAAADQAEKTATTPRKRRSARASSRRAKGLLSTVAGIIAALTRAAVGKTEKKSAEDADGAEGAAFTRDNLPGGDDPRWGQYQKIAPTRMLRIEGPFTVTTREGAVACEDGWLAVDSAGWPYPIDVAEQAAIYRPLTDEPATGGTETKAGPPIAVGSYVTLGDVTGRVDQVVTSGTVPGAVSPSGEPVEGSEKSPAVRILVYREGAGGWSPTKEKMAAPAVRCRRRPPLLGPAGKSLQETVAAIAAAWTDDGRPIDAAALAEVAGRGVKSWPGETVTSLSSAQWAAGRVDAFLHAIAGEQAAGYRADNDLIAAKTAHSGVEVKTDGGGVRLLDGAPATVRGVTGGGWLVVETAGESTPFPVDPRFVTTTPPPA